MSSNLTPQVTLRAAILEDLETIKAIEQVNFSTTAVGAETIQKWIAHVPNTCLIAELNEKIAGYIVGSAVFSRHLTDELFEKVAENSDLIFIALKENQIKFYEVPILLYSF